MKGGFLNTDKISEAIDEVEDSSLKSTLSSLLDTYKSALDAERSALNSSDKENTDREYLDSMRSKVQDAKEALLEAIDSADIDISDAFGGRGRRMNGSQESSDSSNT